MKRFLLVLLAVVVMGNLAVAGDDATPKTKMGDKAWLFTLGGLNALGAGNYMGGLGIKYYLADGLALRGSVGFGSSSETQKNPTSPVPAGQITESKRTTTTFSVNPGITYNIATAGPVVGFVGAQVMFASGSDEQTGSTTLGTFGFASTTSIKVTSTTFGVAALAGFEWFVWNNISLGAEYQLGFSTASGKADVQTPAVSASVDTGPNTNINLASASGANLTLSVYW